MKGLLTNLAVMVVGWLINQAPDEDIRSYGEKAGRWLTDNARDKLGGSWESIEEKLQAKETVFRHGLSAGLDYDDGTA